MNAVEIEEAIGALAERPFDADEFPFAFLEAFGNKEATIKKLRAGASNKSDVGGVLQVNHIHLKSAAPGEVAATLAALRNSEATQSKRNKVRYILATDGETLEAENLLSGVTVACAYKDIATQFSFFLQLAGITTAKQVVENELDTRAAMRLQRLYVELLKDNPDWATADRRHEMNHFMARLIFCFFAEDTDIFHGTGLFTSTIEQMSARDSSNTDHVISQIFRAMNTKITEREGAALPRWADTFPYVNGGLFSGSIEAPKFSKIARSYLLHIGNLDWKRINPDIFGSMIQAVADDEERGALGMHYTSVPNILKVLNPLFLDELREKLAEAGDNARKLLNLRNRMARIRVFDPACGSGNFLVIAYKEMRAVEGEINKRRDEAHRRSDIPLTNFRGIELRHFPAEIARLALIIAEFQCDVLYRGPKLALAEFLPLDADNWITCGNALRLDWLSICPPAGTGVKLQGDDLFSTPLDQPEIDFENEGGETYICGNPPYVGGKKQTADQKADMKALFGNAQHKNLDYVCAFILKCARFLDDKSKAALVSTNSVAQGTHVPTLWPILKTAGVSIFFAHGPFKWTNNATKNAGVTCVIIGLSRSPENQRYIFEGEDRRAVRFINAYLIDGPDVVVEGRSAPLSQLSSMMTGNAAYDEGHLFLTSEQAQALIQEHPELSRIVRRVTGTTEFIDGLSRYCLWIDDELLPLAKTVSDIRERIEKVHQYRQTGGEVAKTLTSRPHQFRYRHVCATAQIIVPQVSSERRPYLPVGWLSNDFIITHLAHAVYSPNLMDFAVLSSRLHLTWVTAICGKLETRIRYASNSGWNAFPLPAITQKNIHDLSCCAEDILLAREAYFPATIAELYNPDHMPPDLREAHDRNDEVLERIYIGRRFKNDTERLEKLFELYIKMSEGQPSNKKRKTGVNA